MLRPFWRSHVYHQARLATRVFAYQSVLERPTAFESVTKRGYKPGLFSGLLPTRPRAIGAPEMSDMQAARDAARPHSAPIAVIGAELEPATECTCARHITEHRLGR